MSAGSTFAPERAGASEAELALGRARNVTIRAGEIDELCRAEFEGVVPKATAEAGRVAIEYPRFSLGELIRRPAQRVQITLNRALPWSIALPSGVADANLDLRELELRALEITAGANLRVLLPEPRGRVLVSIDGGASGVTLERPRGSAALLKVVDAASDLVFDDRRLEALVGEALLETTSAGSQDDRYEIDVAGGASALTVAVRD